MGSDQNHQLLIMRHAKSDWDADYDTDFDRPLSQRGVRDAKRMGRWLKDERLMPDAVISSPARRASQTIKLVMDELGMNIQSVVWDDRIYEAGLGDLLAVIDSHAPGNHRVMFVGHNPGLDRLVDYLAKDEPETTASGKLMTTAAIAVLDYRGGGISSNDKSATLVALIRPRRLP